MRSSLVNTTTKIPRKLQREVNPKLYAPLLSLRGLVTSHNHYDISYKRKQVSNHTDLFQPGSPPLLRDRAGGWKSRSIEFVSLSSTTQKSRQPQCQDQRLVEPSQLSRTCTLYSRSSFPSQSNADLETGGLCCARESRPNTKLPRFT